jgi:hypothetical protein
MHKFVKIFENLVNKTLFNANNALLKFKSKKKSNPKVSSIVKSFENLVNKMTFNANKSLLKFTNNTNSKPKVSSLNKYIISFISLLFLYLFYLSIPNLYDKSWVQNNLESKLSNEFKINFSISSEIAYNILPSPHFLIRNAKIFRDTNGNMDSLSEIKQLRIFIEQKNFFRKEKMNIKKVLINNANFSLNGKDINLLNKISVGKLSDKKIQVANSNIFFKNSLNETFAIVKISKVNLFYDNLILTNILDLSGEIFNLPFSFSLKEQVSAPKVRQINIESKKIKLKIFNESIRKSDNLTTGLNNISILNSKIHSKYEIVKNIIIFKSKNSKINNSNIDYNGKLLIKPFDLNLDINLDKYELTKIFDVNSIFFEFLKTELFFNENISANISLNTTFHKIDEIFDSAKINFNLVNGNINFNHTEFINNKIGSLKVVESILFLEKNKLILNSDIEIDIKDSDNLFSLLQTPKKKRNFIKKVYFNFDYDFLADQIFLNNFRVDGDKNNDEMVKIINDFYRNKKNNTTVSRHMLNRLFSFYDG